MSSDNLDVITGEILRDLRTRCKLTQEQLGSAVGLGQQAIQKYESGSVRITLTRLFDLTKALSIAPYDFVWLIATRHGDAMRQKRRKK